MISPVPDGGAIQSKLHELDEFPEGVWVTALLLFTNCVNDELVREKFPTLLFVLSSQVNSNPFTPNKLPDDDTVIL